MHQYKKRIILHTGSMFSGKTSSLDRDLKRFAIANYKVMAFKPKIDNRFSKDDIVTHDKVKIAAKLIENTSEILEYVKKYSPEVIGIDEVQFLNESPESVIDNLEKMLDLDKIIVLAGLDMDYEKKPFEIVKELMPRVDYLNKHHAVCRGCGKDALYSHRKISGDNRVLIGASEEYEPLCRECYDKAIIEDKLNKNQEKFF